MPYAKTNSARLSKLILERPLEFFWKKKFFSNFSKLFIVPLLWAKHSKPSDGKNKEGLSNQPVTCGKRHSEGKMKTPQRFSFRVLTAEKKCRRFLGRLAIFFVEHRNTLRKTVSVKIYFLSFWDFECNFSVFCKNKLSEVARFSFYVSRENFFS